MILSCVKKVPFTQDYGYFSFSSAHWFENENVAYFFFSIDEPPERIKNSTFQLSYSWRNEAGGAESKDFEDVDFNTGVHEHQLVKCGSKRLCGSYSWRLDGPLLEVGFRLQYDKESDLFLDSYFIPLQNHQILEGDSNSFSAIPYGVFNEDNDRVQFRIFNNFGYPSSEDIPIYGMNRRFEITDSFLNNSQDIKTLNTTIAKTGYVFPADFCEDRADSVQESSVIANKPQYWLSGEYDKSLGDIGACLKVDFLNKDDDKLISTEGYALRNPKVSENGMKIKTPLQALIQIPVSIEVCDGPFAPSLKNDDYLEYQKFIMGMGNRPVDVCFNIDNPTQFREDLKGHLETRLTDTKLNNGIDKDYIFIVIFHEVLSREFHHIHSIVAEELNKLAVAEADFNTPKLVGSMVYGSTADYEPTLIQKKYMMWCPQNPIDIFEDFELPISMPNCTTSRGSELKILGINFVAPMGPFPDLSNYTDYTEKYGDTGIAKEPKLVLQSVPSGENTIIEKRAQVTYFDNVRLTIGEGEAIKVCNEKEGSSLLNHLRFRPTGFENVEEGLDIESVQIIWNSEDPIDSYKVGIKWEFPFWGGISFKSQVAVDVVAVIPFFKDFNQYQSLGDAKWSISEWPIGDYLNHCRQYCDHPFFDVNGVYRNNATWRLDSSNQCTPHSPPEWFQEVNG